MARAIWKGRIRFGTVDVPVKLYSAVQDQSIHFRLLDARRKEPIKQKMVNPETGKVVESDQIRRAFPTETGKLVILDEEELDALEPEASRDIEITRFVKTDRITHQWYDRPYYLGPDDDNADYFALAEALGKEGVEGVARWVMRDKEYVGALRADGGYLLLITATAVWTAWRAIRDKHDPVAFTGPVYRGFAVANLLAGVGVLVLGHSAGSPLLMGFAAVGLFAGQDMLRKRARIVGRPLWWREEHYGAMLGNGVATHIAFLGLGLPRLMPMIDGTALHYVAWFGPLLVAIVAKPLLDRRFAASKGPNQAT